MPIIFITITSGGPTVGESCRGHREVSSGSVDERHRWAGPLSCEKPIDQDADFVPSRRKATRQPNAWRPVLFAIAAVLIGRSLSVYLLVPVSNLFAENIPVLWQHVMVWGGLRGALALALALSLDNTFPYRDRILDLTFGVVVFSILLQGVVRKNSV